MNEIIEKVTNAIIQRSVDSRRNYEMQMQEALEKFPPRKQLSCGNLAHGFAACPSEDKSRIRLMEAANIGIVTAYNDILSAHKPYENYPHIIRQALREIGCSAQVAGGVPAMCDGVTQGQAGMELSLFSRDQIALSAAIALSHNLFDGVLYLGICDKIVPGLLMAALRFGHLPAVFVPAGPMTSGLPNAEKARVRQAFAQGKADREQLLDVESKSYHGQGTCTFYGTANSNQMLMEFMGLQLPGSSFVNPSEILREKLTIEAARRVAKLTGKGSSHMPLFRIMNEKVLVNGMVGLLATGGSTNHTLHLVAIARACGVNIIWEDFAQLSKAVPLLASVYPNGEADVNRFHNVGGLAFVIRQLLDAELLHEDVETIVGSGLRRFCVEPYLKGETLAWKDGRHKSLDENVLRAIDRPFQKQGGLSVLSGNLGLGVTKTSALNKEHFKVEAPAVVFNNQDEMIQAYHAGKLNCDCIVVIRYQGPKSNGMPELHKLTPLLANLQDKGHHVALVTDGRMSGAFGKVLAAIHVTPEASEGGLLAKLHDGDRLCVDAHSGRLSAEISNEEWQKRTAVVPEYEMSGVGREMFSVFRQKVSGADSGATIFDW